MIATIAAYAVIAFAICVVVLLVLSDPDFCVSLLFACVGGAAAFGVAWAIQHLAGAQ